MDGQPMKGLLLGCALGLVLWMLAGLAVFIGIGYLPPLRVSLWWLLSVLVAFAGAEVVRTLLRGRSASPYPPGKPSPS